MMLAARLVFGLPLLALGLGSHDASLAQGSCDLSLLQLGINVSGVGPAGAGPHLQPSSATAWLEAEGLRRVALSPRIPVRPPDSHGGPVLPESWVWDQLDMMLPDDVEDAPNNFVSVQQKEKYEFLHIPKTAGTAVEYAGSVSGVFWGSKKPEFRHGRPLMPDGNLCSHWHIPVQMLERLHRFDPYKEAKGVFCVTRHPYNKLVSEYTYRVALGVLNKWAGYPKCSEGALNNYLQFQMNRVKRGKRYVKDCHFLPQSEYIWDDASGTKWCSHVLSFDDLPNEMSRLMNDWSLPVTLASGKKNPSAQKCPGLDTRNLSSHTKHLIREVYKSDFDRLGFDPNKIY